MKEIALVYFYFSRIVRLCVRLCSTVFTVLQCRIAPVCVSGNVAAVLVQQLVRNIETSPFTCCLGIS